MKLNKEQLQAIRHGNGPLLIIAGAGTGKTTVITERVKYLIEKKLADPSEILALTFTEKAAREMETRIDVALPYGYTDMWTMTFHSFCERILRQNALQIGLDPRFKLMTEAETVQLIRNNLFDFNLNYFRPLGNPGKFIGGMLQHFSRLQDEDISSSDYVAWMLKQETKDKAEKLEIEKWRELASAYETYEELKIKNGFLDFGDLITKTLKLFRERPNVLKEYQIKFKFVLIDEFQDTNYAQNKLMILLGGDQQNITVVGDDNQSVYRFRGAAISNIMQFKKIFPEAKIVTLTKNYRSTQAILDSAYKLIKFNDPDTLEFQLGINKKLVSQRDVKGIDPEFIHADRIENEADLVAQKIKKLSKKYDYKDFAILVRANNHAEPFVRALERHGIPNQFLGPGKLFKQPEVVDLISYLRVLYNFEDSSSFYRVLTMDIFEINPREVAAMLNYARKNNISLFEAAEKSKEENVIKVIDLIRKHLGLIRKETAGNILYDFLESSGILSSLVKPETEGAEKRANNISKFFDKLKGYEVDYPDANLFNVVDWIDLASEIGESPLAADTDWVESDSVNVLTVHSAKGLEFPVVFLVNLVAQRFPTTERHEQIPIPDGLIKEILPKGDYHIQEERRLFYVGMTRAKERLFFTAADYYGEGKRGKKISQFVFESLGNLEQDKKQTKESGKNALLGYEKVENKEILKKSNLKIDYLSYSQIEAFKICPLHFKLRYILKIPTQTTASLSFGIAMHNTLLEFYELVKSETEPSEDLILKVLNNNWIKEGFTSRGHENEFFKKGEKFLSEYFAKEFDVDNHPTHLEEPFIVPISKDLKIGGKIDRIDDLGNGKIEIWDYKTGASVPTQKDADKDLQLTIYALAVTDLFGKKPEEIKLSLYYFETQTKISTTRTKEDLEKAKTEILKIRDEIQKSDFKCSGGFLCRNCEYKLFCKTED